MRNIFRRIAIVPFEMSIAFLALGSGITGLLHIGFIDPINQILPNWEADTLNSSLVLCGVGLIWGVLLANGAIESVGLWLLNATIAARFLLFGSFFGYGKEFIITGLLDVSVVAAGIVRLWSIRTKHILLKTKEVIDVDDLIG